ncbi:Uncharacterised protein [Vibrio cholerae]|nr:Uncharacterised protein [Vibrio cholerae]CSC77736.1 Uncharacterised protein [Vibrio cholerae]
MTHIDLVFFSFFIKKIYQCIKRIIAIGFREEFESLNKSDSVYFSNSVALIDFGNNKPCLFFNSFGMQVFI